MQNRCIGSAAVPICFGDDDDDDHCDSCDDDDDDHRDSCDDNQYDSDDDQHDIVVSREIFHKQSLFFLACVK